jgi:hypothetical protein
MQARLPETLPSDRSCPRSTRPSVTGRALAQVPFWTGSPMLTSRRKLAPMTGPAEETARNTFWSVGPLFT